MQLQRRLEEALRTPAPPQAARPPPGTDAGGAAVGGRLGRGRTTPRDADSSGDDDDDGSDASYRDDDDSMASEPRVALQELTVDAVSGTPVAAAGARFSAMVAATVDHAQQARFGGGRSGALLVTGDLGAASVATRTLGARNEWQMDAAGAGVLDILKAWEVLCTPPRASPWTKVRTLPPHARHLVAAVEHALDALMTPAAASPPASGVPITARTSRGGPTVSQAPPAGLDVALGHPALTAALASAFKPDCSGVRSDWGYDPAHHAAGAVAQGVHWLRLCDTGADAVGGVSALSPAAVGTPWLVGRDAVSVSTPLCDLLTQAT
jgi:hypothetical protein